MEDICIKIEYISQRKIIVLLKQEIINAKLARDTTTALSQLQWFTYSTIWWRTAMTWLSLL